MMRMTDKSSLRQFISYFFVGGIAALVEWVMFAVFSNLLGVNYVLATCMAFVLSTATNWILGRLWTFKDSKRYAGKELKEAALVFLVSAVGLALNIGLMYLFVTVMGLNTDMLRLLSKVMATGIVFVWNFLIRKLVIYK